VRPNPPIALSLAVLLVGCAGRSATRAPPTLRVHAAVGHFTSDELRAFHAAVRNPAGATWSSAELRDDAVAEPAAERWFVGAGSYVAGAATAWASAGGAAAELPFELDGSEAHLLLQVSAVPDGPRLDLWIERRPPEWLRIVPRLSIQQDGEASVLVENDGPESVRLLDAFRVERRVDGRWTRVRRGGRRGRPWSEDIVVPSHGSALIR
ncbi:MAG: hypothetical protein ACK4N5_19780, partial [Myxococcales bacterium]